MGLRIEAKQLFHRFLFIIFHFSASLGNTCSSVAGNTHLKWSPLWLIQADPVVIVQSGLWNHLKWSCFILFLSLSFWCKRSIFICKLFFKGFVACGLPATHFLKGLAFPRSAKIISRKVWHFRAWRKSFPERFSISALGESHFPKGLAFPRSAKIVSRIIG